MVKHALGQRPSSVHEIGPGDANRVFRVELRDRVVVARTQFFRDNTKRYMHEQQSMDVARQLGILVPPVRAIGRWHKHSYMIQDYIRGRDPSEINVLKSWGELGRLARRLGTRPWPTTPEKRNLYVDGLLRHVSTENTIKKSGVLAPGEFSAAVNLARELATLRLDRVFQHGDLKPKNVILDSRGRYWLIGWNSAGGHPQYYCLVQVYCRAAEDPEFSAFRYGYGMTEQDWERKRSELRPLIAAVLLRKIFRLLRNGTADGVEPELYVSRLKATLQDVVQV